MIARVASAIPWLALSFLLSRTACAAVWYISNNGSDDTGDGSRGAPYATIGKAMEQGCDAQNANVYLLKRTCNPRVGPCESLISIYRESVTIACNDSIIRPYPIHQNTQHLPFVTGATEMAQNLWYPNPTDPAVCGYDFQNVDRVEFIDTNKTVDGTFFRPPRLASSDPQYDECQGADDPSCLDLYMWKLVGNQDAKTLWYRAWNTVPDGEGCDGSIPGQGLSGFESAAVPFVIDTNDKDDVLIRDVRLYGAGLLESETEKRGAVILVRQSDRVTLTNVHVSISQRYGIEADAATDVTILDSEASYAGAACIRIGNFSSDIHIRGTTQYSTKVFRCADNRGDRNSDGNGIRIQKSSDVTISNVDVYDNGYTGGVFTGPGEPPDPPNGPYTKHAVQTCSATNVTLTNSRVRDNYRGGFAIDDDQCYSDDQPGQPPGHYRYLLSGNYLTNNGRHGDNQQDHDGNLSTAPIRVFWSGTSVEPLDLQVTGNHITDNTLSAVVSGEGAVRIVSKCDDANCEPNPHVIGEIAGNWITENDDSGDDNDTELPPNFSCDSDSATRICISGADQAGQVDTDDSSTCPYDSSCPVP